MTPKGNEPAFANSIKITDESFAELRGLTKREYFAAIAMQGICGNENYVECGPADLARVAKNIADALLKELDKNADI